MEIRTFSMDVLERLIRDALLQTGVGGYVSARDIARVFNPMSAVEFAQIVYATDDMIQLIMVAGKPNAEKAKEATEVENVAPFIENKPSEERPCFKYLVDLFETQAGREVRAEFL